MYFLIEPVIGYWAYLSLTPFLTILILSRVPGRLSAELMCLYLICISVNILAWYTEGNGAEVEELYQRTSLFLFGIQTLLLLSRWITDGIHRTIHKYVVARDLATA
jgi:hypothetical protein